MQARILLALAIVAEVTGTLFMKQASVSNSSLGFILMLLLVGASYIMFAWSIKTIPLGIAYALWEGIGLIAITSLSILIFSEVMTMSKIIGLIILLVGVRFVSQGSADDTNITDRSQSAVNTTALA